MLASRSSLFAKRPASAKAVTRLKCSIRNTSSSSRLARGPSAIVSSPPRMLKLHDASFWADLESQLMSELLQEPLYVLLLGYECLSHEDLALLGKLLTTVGAKKPTVNIIPVLPALWPQDRLQDLGITAADTQPQHSTAAGSPPAAAGPLPPPWPTHSTPPSASPPPSQGHIVGPSQRLQFKAVAVGGTFDRLHAGHRLLLATTALVASERVYIGVTADALLASKKARELLQSYEQREAAAREYVAQVHPGLQVETGPLRDPNEPTLAETDPDMEAIVVSEETLVGAQAINAGRAKRGFRPLHIVVVSLVWPRSASSKLSSTDLRLQEQQAAAQQPA